MFLSVLYRFISSMSAVKASSEAAGIQVIKNWAQGEQCRDPLYDGSEPRSFFRTQWAAITAVSLPIPEPFLENRVATEFVFPDGLWDIGEKHLFGYE